MTPPDRAAGLARAPRATDAAARPRRRATDPATLAQTDAAQPGV